nr:hypothetical protein [Prevotella sp.]
MMNEEKKINDIFGKENHFKVPEGYFDNFAEQMMAKIPVQEIDSLEEPGKELLENKAKLVHLSLWRRLPLRKIAAVLAVTAMLGGGVLYQLQQSEKKHHALAHKETPAIESSHVTDGDDVAFEQMADYTMMDSQDFYAQLVAEN